MLADLGAAYGLRFNLTSLTSTPRAPIPDEKLARRMILTSFNPGRPSCGTRWPFSADFGNDYDTKDGTLCP